MKNKFRFAKLLVIAFAIVFVGCKKQEPLPGHSVLGNQLLALDIVSSLDTIIPNQNPANFKELYKIKFTQPIDHNNPSAGTFQQKAFLFYVGNDRPTVLYTCGYTLSDDYMQQPFLPLAYNMNANLLMVEHRYFGESKPANDPRWTYLNMKQAASDHHAIIQALKPLLPKEWVSTGTSKDGMTSVFLRYFYPDDITVTTAFCAPFMTSLTYEPVGRYVQEVSGSPQEHDQMIAVLNRMLQGGESGLYARFRELLREANITEEYSYTDYVASCFHYMFSFFSYQTPSTRHMASLDLPNDQFINTVLKEVFHPTDDGGSSYPYGIQTAKELGQFIFDYNAFANVLNGTSFDINALKKNPSGLKDEDLWVYETYDNTLLTDIRNRFIPTTTCPILFVYSKDDPWTGARPDQINEQYSKLIINPLGIHDHDINNEVHYSPETRTEIMDFIARFVPYGDDPVVAKRPAYNYDIKTNDRFMIFGSR